MRTSYPNSSDGGLTSSCYKCHIPEDHIDAASSRGRFSISSKASTGRGDRAMQAVRFRMSVRAGMVIVAASAGVFWLLSLVGEARESGLRHECGDHMKQVGLGLHNF